ncbi:acetate kinase [Candidatus Parcubacteria bacterium]|nr:MAG: acetate kinase [Candidatus Parcubacteria bacterium]
MPKNILTINTGSTSLKYSLFDENEKEIQSGVFRDVVSHSDVIKKLLRQLKNVSDIYAIGHRIVHGGEHFVESVALDTESIDKLKSLNDIAPLHNPYNLLGVKIFSEFLPNTQQVAVFDTAFFADLPDRAKLYAIPNELSEKYKIKKYGFHGISHKYLTQRVSEKLGKPENKINLITCHLGGGWSISAIKGGKPIDTSMGFTPIEGLMMMTRAGDLGSGVVFELLREGLGTSSDVERLYDILNKESGIKAISGGIDDYQTLLRELNLGNTKAKLAFDMAIYRVSKYIGAYYVALAGKVDAIVFSGSIGSGNPVTRNEILKNIKVLGKLKTFAIETNEGLLIARETKKIVN